METMDTYSSLHGMLSDESLAELTIGFGPIIKELSSMFKGYELLDEIIKNARRYATRELGYPNDTDMSELDSETFDTIHGITGGILQRLVPGFISDTHREFFVRCHARGLSTTEAFMELIPEDETIQRLIQPDAVGLRELKSLLVTRLAYLKPGSARWPEKKYGAIWRDERESHKKEVRDIPFTTPTEQAALLAKHAGRIDDELERNEHSAADWQLLTNSLVKTLDSLRKVAEVKQQGPANLSGTQLIGVLERLTLALDAPEQLALSTDTDALVGVLERLTLALKSPSHKAVAGKVKAIPVDTNTEDGISA